jgi:hypothetical protein
MENITLNTDQQRLLCSIINNIGTGEHPCADEKTLKYFTTDYVLELCEKAKAKLNEAGNAILESIVELLNKN